MKRAFRLNRHLGTVRIIICLLALVAIAGMAGCEEALPEVPVINSFAANPEVIVLGGNSTLSWSVSGATEVTIDQGIGSVDPTGTHMVSPTRTVTYTITASNSAGTQTATFQVQMPVVYDFVAQASHNRTLWASGWASGGAFLAFPGAESDSRGFARYVADAVLEDNETYDQVLETHPYWADDGYIRGGYFGLWDLGYEVEAGDRFHAKVGFLKNASAGNVKFTVLMVQEDESQTSIAEVSDAYDGTLQTIDIDLSSYADERATFMLEVTANGPSSQDWAVWLEARIIHPYVL